jgi:hypothetical protein
MSHDIVENYNFALIYRMTAIAVRTNYCSAAIQLPKIYFFILLFSSPLLLLSWQSAKKWFFYYYSPYINVFLIDVVVDAALLLRVVLCWLFRRCFFPLLRIFVWKKREAGNAFWIKLLPFCLLIVAWIYLSLTWEHGRYHNINLGCRNGGNYNWMKAGNAAINRWMRNRGSFVDC